MRPRSLFSFDLVLFGATLALTVVGVLFVYSSGVSSTGVVLSREYVKQIIWVALGLVLLLATVFAGYRRLEELSPYVYGFLVILLIATLFFGRVVNGARSWIPVFEFGLQPSEFMKIGVILFLARFLDQSREQSWSLRRFILGLGIVLAPVLLILLQPDMGTSIVYFPIFLTMVFIAGAPARYLVYTVLTGFLVVTLTLLPGWQEYIVGREVGGIALFISTSYAPYVFGAMGLILALGIIGLIVSKRRYYYWIVYITSSLFTSFVGSILLRLIVKEYQIKRLIVFLDPSIDPQGAGWNVIQSITAVGSGGALGKGWLKGTQSHYRFLPQQSTDFIFSIIAEEWGFLGSIFVFSLFLVIIIRAIFILRNARDNYAAYLSAGLIGIITFHVVVNIGMAMGIMPITGIPLLFLSYGGSSLWTALIGIGLLLNIHIHRYNY